MMRKHTMLLSKQKKEYQKGFTLAEMIVVIAIILIITGVTLANYRTFNDDALLENTAYDIALTIHQMQTYGVTVKETDPGSQVFNAGYGIHFDAQTPNSYILYKDVPTTNDPATEPAKNFSYDGPSELISQIQLPKNYHFSNICVTYSSVTYCYPSQSPLGFVDIEFVRPNLNAVMTQAGTGPGALSFQTSFPYAYYQVSVTIMSDKSGKTKTVTVGLSGQISVQ